MAKPIKGTLKARYLVIEYLKPRLHQNEDDTWSYLNGGSDSLTVRELAAANPGETFTLNIVENVRKEIFGVLRPCRSVTNDQVADMKAAMNALEAAHDSLLATVTQLAGEVRALQDLAEELSARIRTIEHQVGRP